MTENRLAYPVRVDASLDPSLSGWLWRVRWLLLLPHYVVLSLLWVDLVVVTVIAFIAILITGGYPPFRLDMGGTDPGSMPPVHPPSIWCGGRTG